MGDKTKIGWADSTLNLWIGCTQVSPACDRCYAMKLAVRLKIPWNAPPKRTVSKTWTKIESYQRTNLQFAKKHGRRRRVFVNSLSDFFDNQAALAWVHEACERMAAAPDVIWMLVTKRPQNVAKRVPKSWLKPGGWPENVWLLVTAENQEEANRRIPILLSIPGVRVRGASIEPLLGPVDLTKIEIQPARHPERGQPPVTFDALKGWMGGADPNGRTRLNWVIIGGESGRDVDVRVMHPEWAREIIGDCRRERVAVFFKQWGEYAPLPYSTQPHSFGGLLNFRTNREVMLLPRDQAGTIWLSGKKTKLAIDTKPVSGAKPAANGDVWFLAERIGRVGTRKAGNEIDGEIYEEFPA